MTNEHPVAIVTGAARGIGQATAAQLGADGWAVVASDRNPRDDVFECDVTSQHDVDRLIQHALDRHGRIDALVNVAGAGWKTDFLSATDEIWSRHLEINLMGTVRVTRAAIPYLRQSQHPARGIVNFTSQAAKTGGLVVGAPYSAAKAAVLCLTKTLAAEFGRDGLRVNAVAPGIIETAFLDEVPQVRQHAAAMPLGRIGAASEVASVVSFLLSTKASYLTGEIVDVNGGLLMD